MTSFPHIMTPYDNLGCLILEKGTNHGDRTGKGRRSLFGHQLRFDIDGMKMPIDSSRQIYPKSACNEILWMLAGSTDVSLLKEMRCNFWDKWTYNLSTPEQKKFLKGNTASMEFIDSIGPMYGAIWRGEFGISYIVKKKDTAKTDQLSFVLNTFLSNQHSSRLRMTAWDPELIPKDEKEAPWKNVAKGGASLTPCHGDVQFLYRYDEENKLKLTVVMFQRSADYMLGVPHNIAQYAFLAHWMAYITNAEAEELVINYGDVHIYCNHIEDATKQFSIGQNLNSTPTLVLKETPALVKLRDSILYFRNEFESGKENNRYNGLGFQLKDYFDTTIQESKQANVFEIEGYDPFSDKYSYEAAV
jgi:thymidylate synthase